MAVEVGVPAAEDPAAALVVDEFQQPYFDEDDTRALVDELDRFRVLQQQAAEPESDDEVDRDEVARAEVARDPVRRPESPEFPLEEDEVSEEEGEEGEPTPAQTVPEPLLNRDDFACGCDPPCVSKFSDEKLCGLVASFGRMKQKERYSAVRLLAFNGVTYPSEDRLRRNGGGGIRSGTA